MESGVGVEKDYRNQQPDNGSVLYGAEGSIQASKGRDEQQRWSAKGKMEVVLRILRGEPVDGLSRELRVAVPDLVRWRDDFLARGLANLKARPAGPTEEQLRQAQAKIGDLAMRLELGRSGSSKKGALLAGGSGLGDEPGGQPEHQQALSLGDGMPGLEVLQGHLLPPPRSGSSVGRARGGEGKARAKAGHLRRGVTGGHPPGVG